MAKKAIKTDGADQNGSAGSSTENSTAKRIDVEVVPKDPTLSKSGKPLTLAQLEANVEKARGIYKRSAWDFAVAVTAIHDSKLYPHVGETNGFYTYMQEKWEYGKAQAANIVGWVKKEIKAELVLVNPALEDIKPKDIDSLKTPPPAAPKKGKTASRGKGKGGGGGKTGSKKVYIIEDVNGELATRLVTRKEADESGSTIYSNLEDAKSARDLLQKQRDEQQQKKQEHAPKQDERTLEEKVEEIMNEHYPPKQDEQTGTRPTAGLNPLVGAIFNGDDVHRPDNFGWWSAQAEGQLGDEYGRFHDEVCNELEAFLFKYEPHEADVLDIMSSFIESQREMLEDQGVKDVEDENNESIS